MSNAPQKPGLSRTGIRRTTAYTPKENTNMGAIHSMKNNPFLSRLFLIVLLSILIIPVSALPLQVQNSTEIQGSNLTYTNDTIGVWKYVTIPNLATENLSGGLQITLRVYTDSYGTYRVRFNDTIVWSTYFNSPLNTWTTLYYNFTVLNKTDVITVGVMSGLSAT
jgi:hypothetical protein